MNPVSRVGVPPPPQHFLGRADAVRILRDGLLSSDAPAILLQGGPGIGKSALTKAVAHHADVVKRFGGNRWFVELETVQSAESLRDAIVRALGREPAAGLAAALESLKGRPALLILDNLETPWEAEQQQTEDTLAELARVPGLALLASFRGRERIRGPAWTLTHAVGQLDAPSATDLFCRIAERELAGDPFLARFIEALEGVPLAIELVATRAYGDTALKDLWAEWHKIGALAAEIPDAEPSRRTSLAHSIKLSLKTRRITAAAERLFRLLGRLPAGLAAEDRDALIGADGFKADEALRRCALALGRDGRIDLLSPVRQFAAREPLSAADDETRWMVHFLTLARERGEPIGHVGGEGAAARLLPEAANIEAAFAAAIEAHRLDLAISAVEGFARFAFISALPSPILLRLAEACRQVKNVVAEANCIFWTGTIAWTRSDYAAAKSAFEQAQPLYQQAGRPQGEANCIHRLGDVAQARGDLVAARSSFEQALALFEKLGDVLGEANCICRLGDVALTQVDLASARAAYEKALPLYRRVGNVQGEANCISRLGEIAQAQSDYPAAQSAFEKALAIYQQVGDVRGQANCFLGFGGIAQAQRDHAAARAAYGKALPLYRRVGDVLREAHCVRRLAEIAQAEGDRAAARSSFEKALSMYRQVGDASGENACLSRLAELGKAP